MAYVWGVDSAAPVNNRLLQCVVRQFGKPRFWGRYLSTVPRVASGLTGEEIAFLHGENIKIMPIYNDFRHAVGYQDGKNVAQRAIQHATGLGIAKGTFLFANIEHFFRVDEAWIRGWVDTLRTSGYKAGIYHDPVRGPFARAFCSAARRNGRIRMETALWSAQPEKTTTGPRNAPAYAPGRPSCASNVMGWQYGRDSKLCPIDTNLIEEALFRQLY